MAKCNTPDNEEKWTESGILKFTYTIMANKNLGQMRFKLTVNDVYRIPHTPDGNALHQKLMEVCRLNLTDSERTRIGGNFSEAAITKLKKVKK